MKLGYAAWGLWIIGFGAVLGSYGQSLGPIPAFPGAEGFGVFTPGGRGGKVYLVTTLADYETEEPPISGSLRAAVEAEGPRIVVFRVAGYIDLKRPLVVRHPYLTIAGQTAPGEGITLRNYGLEIEAPHVVIRYLRVRPGDGARIEQDAINVRASYVVIDHCSVSWATDEVLSVSGRASEVTIQWCLIAESLNQSVHHKGAHGYGSLFSSGGRISVHHTIYAFHASRNPRPKDVLLDFRNNLIYGFGERAGYSRNDQTRINYVGNYLYPLPYSQNSQQAFILEGINTRLFLQDNVIRFHDRVEQRDWALIRPPEGWTASAIEAQARARLPFPAPAIATVPSKQVLTLLLAEAGATRPHRDAVDRRILELIHQGKGLLIDSQEDVGGWPTLEVAAPPPDSDQDGMPDDWELRYGLNPNDPLDTVEDLDGDGYTNIEEYLNGTDPTQPLRWIPPPSILPDPAAAPLDSVITVRFELPDTTWPVHYTVDGREPTAQDPRYTGPFQVRRPAHVRARFLVESDTVFTTTAFAFYDSLEVLAATTPPKALRQGLLVRRYRATDWDESPPIETLTPVTTDTVAYLDLRLWGDEPIIALCFEGYMHVPTTGWYGFYIDADPRSRLWIDGRFVAHGRAPEAGPFGITLAAGWHRVRLLVLREADWAPVRLAWQQPGEPPQPLHEIDFFVEHPLTP